MKNIIITLAIIMMTSACSKQPVSHSRVKRENFQSVIDGKNTDLYTLKNKNGLEITVTNFGARVVEFFTPDKDGNFEDIVLGHDHIDKYINFTGERFLGATIGRYGNRIAEGKFTLDSVQYQLPTNDGPNSLHGGTKGFDMVVWDVEQVSPQKLELSYLSKDGEEGYPGNLAFKAIYTLNKDTFLPSISSIVSHEKFLVV